MQGDTLRRALWRFGSRLLDKAALVLPMLLIGVLTLAAPSHRRRAGTARACARWRAR
ncbi:hypothetical protein [Streptodolium elevatio]